MYAVEISAGSEKWRFETRGRILSTAALENGALYFGNDDHFVYALDAATGVKKWEFAAEGPITTSPIIAEGLVLFGSRDGNFYAVDAATGVERWAVGSGHSITGDPCISRGTVYFCNRKGAIFAVEISNGETRYWLDGYKPTTPPVAAEGLLLIGCGMKLIAVDADDGEPVWEYQVPAGIKAAPAVDDGLACFASGNFLYGLDFRTGISKWEMLIGSAPKEAPIIADGIIYFTTRNRSFFAVDLKTGAIANTFDLEGRFSYSAPAVDRGWIAVGSLDHNLYGFQVVRWEADETGAEVAVSVPALRPEAVDPFITTPQPYMNAQQPGRLVLLILLFPLYELYWFYRNWKHWQQERQEYIRPGLRTLGMFVPLLNLYLAYDQFRMIRASAAAEQVKSYSLLLVTTGYLSFTALPYTLSWSSEVGIDFAPGPVWSAVLSYIIFPVGSLLFLLIVQRTINELWLKKYPSSSPRDFFTGGEKVMMGLGVLSWSAVLLGLVLRY